MNEVKDRFEEKNCECATGFLHSITILNKDFQLTWGNILMKSFQRLHPPFTNLRDEKTNFFYFPVAFDGYGTTKQTRQI
jgi:hypothetical protein